MARSFRNTFFVLVSTAIAVLVAASLYVGYALAPIALHRFQEAKTAEACGEVRPGMSFSEMSETLHRWGSYSFEDADFPANRFSFSGHGGTCTVDLDQDSGRVTQTHFQPTRPEPPESTDY